MHIASGKTADDNRDTPPTTKEQHVKTRLTLVLLCLASVINNTAIGAQTTNSSENSGSDSVVAALRSTNAPALHVATLQKLAQDGGYRAPAAMAGLGECYRTGYGVPKDLTEAFKWFRKAGEAGDILAMNEVGRAYRYGQGTEKEPETAIVWFRKAITADNDDAMYELGTCYQTGEGVQIDTNQAAKWLTMAADRAAAKTAKWSSEKTVETARNIDDVSKTWGMQYIGDLYHKGGVISRETGQTVHRYADTPGFTDEASTLTNLWLSYLKGEHLSPDFTTAAKWYRKAAKLGHYPAMLAIGRCYERGCGVPSNTTEAATWYRKTAEKGFAASTHNIGLRLVPANG